MLAFSFWIAYHTYVLVHNMFETEDAIHFPCKAFQSMLLQRKSIRGRGVCTCTLKFTSFLTI